MKPAILSLSLLLLPALAGCAGSPPAREPPAPEERAVEESPGQPPPREPAGSESPEASEPRLPPPALPPETAPPAGSPPASPSPRRGGGDAVRRLLSGEKEAERALLELWEAPRESIPGLILEVERTERTRIRELKILIVDPKHFQKLNNMDVDTRTGRLDYNIPGMGRTEYEDVSLGPARAGRALKVVIKHSQGFPLGAVIRSALINRFQSSDYPSGDHRLDIRGWWERFYERVQGRL